LATDEDKEICVGGRVLIVEDEAMVALALGVAAKAQGHHVLGPVATVSGANDLIGSEIIDYALLDYRLADGVADELVGHLSEAGVPFAWLSGCYDWELPPGAEAILPKPFDGEAVRRLLATLPRLPTRAGSK
jgi:DNA-binding response OmpR family regulator